MRTHLFQLQQAVLGRAGVTEVPEGMIRGTAGTVVLKVAFAGLSLLLNVLLARLLNPAGYGSYSYAIAAVGLLSVVGIFGMDQLLVRETAIYEARADWPLLKGLLQRTAFAGVLLSLSLSALAAGAIVWLGPLFDADMRQTLWLGLLLLPLLVQIRLRQATMQGLRYVVAGQIPELVLQPALFIALLLATKALAGAPPSPRSAMAMNLAAAALAVVAGLHLLRTALPAAVTESRPMYRMRAWWSSALPMLLSSGCWVITSRADVLLLGAIRGSEAVGLYSVASRSAELITFFLGAFNFVLAPAMARLHAARDRERLQRMMTQWVRIVFALSLPLAVGLICLGRWWLPLFGHGYVQAHAALAILVGGQLVNVAMGSVGSLLIMTGYERDTARLLAVSAACNITGNALLIPKWGIEGAACATTAGVVLWNVLMVIRVHRRLGIHSTVFGVIRMHGRAA